MFLCLYFEQDDGALERARISELESANHHLQNEVARLSNATHHTEKLVSDLTMKFVFFIFILREKLTFMPCSFSLLHKQKLF